MRTMLNDNFHDFDVLLNLTVPKILFRNVYCHHQKDDLWKVLHKSNYNDDFIKADKQKRDEHRDSF
jgi:hypothetical protein